MGITRAEEEGLGRRQSLLNLPFIYSRHFFSYLLIYIHVVQITLVGEGGLHHVFIYLI